MEAAEALYADEVLSSSSQEGKEPSLTPEEVERTLAQIEAESLVSSLGVKRKREEHAQETFCEVAKSGKRKGRRALTCSYEGTERDLVKGERTEGAPSSPSVFSIDKISLPESCSLFNTVVLSWSVNTPFKFVGANLSHFSFVPQPNKKIKNGIWLKWNLSGGCQEALGKDVYLLIELYERHLHGTNAVQKDQPVAFCGGKCGQKKSEVISLQEKKLPCNDQGLFEAVIAINEQCAHRSDNEYGSPNTRFYFKLQLCEKTIELGAARMVALASAESTLIKVVAPGKSKVPAKASSSSKKAAPPKLGSKMTMKQMMETFLITLQGFDERLQSLERRLEERVPAVKEEVKVEELPDPGNIEYPSIHDEHPAPFKREAPQHNLRQSCEFAIGQDEDFLSLSQEAHLMVPEVLSP